MLLLKAVEVDGEAVEAAAAMVVTEVNNERNYNALSEIKYFVRRFI